jgi:hypothetical protein
MRIQQLHTCNATKHFHNRLLKRYKLETITSFSMPFISFGLYTDEEITFKNLISSDALAVIVWGGSDAMRILYDTNKKKLDKIRSKKNMKHIAISNFIHKDLTIAGIEHVCIPVTQTNEEHFNNTILGNKIFYYNNHNVKKKEFYGVYKTEKILNKYFPDIETETGYSTGTGHVEYTDMHSIYDKCFMGIRLTPHDGLSNVVIEMGLMGRKVIWNGNTPNAIQWSSTQDIIEAIKAEICKIGTLQTQVSKNIIEYINIGEDWLFSEFYDSKNWKNNILKYTYV